MSCHRNVVYTKALLDLRLSAAHGMVYWIIQGLILWMSSVLFPIYQRLPLGYHTLLAFLLAKLTDIYTGN